MARGKNWTDKEDAALLSEAASGMFFDEIAGRHQRGAEAVRSRYRELVRVMSPVDRTAARLSRDKNWSLPPDRSFIASEAAIADRDARASLAHRSLTAAFCGDPLPGRSALDKRPAADAGTANLLSDLPRQSPMDQMRAGLA